MPFDAERLVQQPLSEYIERSKRIANIIDILEPNLDQKENPQEILILLRTKIISLMKYNKNISDEEILEFFEYRPEFPKFEIIHPRSN